MPVPDQVRDDGSGIQKCSVLKQHWIPDQVRNDETATSADWPIATQSVRERELSQTPPQADGVLREFRMSLILDFGMGINSLDCKRGFIMKKIIISLVTILFMAGCSSTGNLGIITKSQANPGSLLSSSHPFKEIGPAKGRACRFFLLGVAPWGNSTFSQAIDNALENGGDALINVSVTSSLYGFVPIYNIFCYTCTDVEGIAIKFQGQ